ncbi:MAG TPA: hypothetical protein VJH03_04980 [Blastocatellia bacterium]|nr:hypothetical protein [Blastocatellia bacterium]
MAAAKGMVPFANEELLEALVALTADPGEDVRAAAAATLQTLDPASFGALAGDAAAPPDVLGFLCVWARTPREIVELAVFNRSTPDAALTQLAARSHDASIIEAISVKQQALIRCPDIIDAILSNSSRSPEAERRALEVRQEFFQKEFGIRMVAEEQRLREQAEAQERAAREARGSAVTVEGIEDLVRLGLIEEGIDDSILVEYEQEFGPFDVSPPPIEQQIEFEETVSQIEPEELKVPVERLPVFQQIALMSIKDRVMLAIKGTREARVILIRDSNRMVAGAVLRNPRLTDAEIESISSLRTVPEDVLRQIGQNRAWMRSYAVIHNLVRNPRTPIPTSLGFLNRIQTRDLRILATNKNIPDVIRTTANRLFLKRGGM